MSFLAVILVNYGDPGDTIACVESLGKSTGVDYRIYVVDNASTAETADRLRTGCPNVTLMTNAENIGFGGGNNTGITRAFGDGADLVLLLNNDTIVAPETLSALAEPFSRSPRAGVAAAKIYYHSEPDLLWYAGGRLSVNAARVAHVGLGTKDAGQFDRLAETDYATGCSLLFSREVYDAIGMLDDGFFAYYEDADFSVRARKAGFPVLFVPAARVWHKVSTTSGWDSPVYIYFNLRNKLLFVRKHASVPGAILAVPELCYYFGRQFIRLILKRRNLTAAKAAWMGTIDGLRGLKGVHGRGRLQQVKEMM
jgi:GT2 family glycosyltransferase